MLTIATAAVWRKTAALLSLSRIPTIYPKSIQRLSSSATTVDIAHPEKCVSYQVSLANERVKSRSSM